MPESGIPAHGGQLSTLAQAFALDEATLLDFSASIHPAAPSPQILAALTQYLTQPQTLAAYPESTYAALRTAIARYAQVHPDSIAVANGVMPLLQSAVAALSIRQCLVLVPAFTQYERTLHTAGVTCHPFTLQPSSNFLPDIDELFCKLAATGAGALLLANPHSPSGVLMPYSLMREIAARAAHAGKTFLVDEAFIDFSPQASMAPRAQQSPSLIVFRSLTKFFAIPGARVAYAVAHPGHKRKLDACIPLWPVDSMAARLAELLLVDGDAPQRCRDTERERTWLVAQLRKLNLQIFPSSANFLLLRVPSEKNLWRDLIRNHQIVVRACANFAGLDAHFFRVAVRTREENTRLVHAFTSLL